MQVQQDNRKIEDISTDELVYIRFGIEDQIKQLNANHNQVVTELLRRANKFGETIKSNGQTLVQTKD